MAVKAAMVTIQRDEYGLGRLEGMHAQLFRRLLEDWDVDATYGAHLERVPAVIFVVMSVSWMLTPLVTANIPLVLVSFFSAKLAK